MCTRLVASSIVDVGAWPAPEQVIRIGRERMREFLEGAKLGLESDGIVGSCEGPWTRYATGCSWKTEGLKSEDGATSERWKTPEA